MKLFSRYNRLNIISTISIFIIGSITFYLLLHYILIHEVDEALEIEQQEIAEHVQKHNTLPEILPTRDQFIAYKDATSLTPVVTSNIDAYYPHTHDHLYRERLFGIAAGGKYYTVSVRKSLEETEDLLQIIIFVTLGMVALILITGYVINRRVLSKLWRPFYSTIDQVKAYNVYEKDTLYLNETNIEEFSLLNNSIASMTERVKKDYQALKEFTGYAAHEMQTPLSVIRIRLDILIQNLSLSQDGSQAINDIEKAVHKLSRLYQSLLLLTKVENRQFVLDEEVQVDKLILEKYNDFSGMLEAKKIELDMNLKPVSIIFHNQLSEILIGNLLSNAIRYNKQVGFIGISLHDNTLIISNSSDLPALSDEQVFQRFYRHSDVTADGNGLGLSIVKQICDMAGYSINYYFADGIHTFTIIFN